MRGHENYRTKRNTALFFFSFLKELLKKVRSYFFPHSMGILTDNTIMRYLLSELFAYFTVSFLFFFIADKYLTTSDGTITFTPPKNDSSANVNYRVTIISKEVPTVKSVVNITVKFEKKPDEAIIQDSGTTTLADHPSESNPLTPDPAPAGE